MSKLQIAVACAALLFSAGNLTAASEPGGPTTLIIAYRCAPANRVSFRDSITKTDIPRFEKWRTEGTLENYRLLFNWYVDENTWDMMAVLSFHHYADVARWREIERSSPGGLSQVSLRLGGPTSTYSADLTLHGTAQDSNGDTSKSVFFVIPYDVVNLEEYKPYVAGYVIPQMQGWMRERVLRNYSLYLNRYYAGKPWDSLLILEYRDMESFGQRENVVAKVRLALSDNKKNIRTEKESVLAEELKRR